MTFYEAAIEVLLKAGRPLHFKKITEAALKDNLLSHIGKTPDVTMGERLNQEVKRQENSPVVCVRPGVYMLREESVEDLKKESRLRPTRALPPRPSEAQSVTPAKDVSSDDSPAPSEGSRSSRRRRRSTRGGRSERSRGGSQGSGTTRVEETPAAVNSVAVSDKTPAAPAPEARETRRESSGSSRRDSSGGGSRRDSSGGSSRRDSSGGSRRRGSRHGRDSGRDSGRERRDGRRERDADVVDAPVEQKHLSQGPVRLDGIAEAAVTVLQDSKKALGVKELADEIFKRRLVRFHTHDAATTVQAALANDNHMRSLRGHRALFVQYDRERWGLSEWGFSKVGVRKEQQILSLAEEIRQDALLHFGDALLSTKAEALEHLALTLLERKGYRNIKVSKRSAEGDVFFTGDWHHGLSEIRVCIEVVGDNQRELGSDAVTELRSTLHHYSASEGVIIHLGSISAAAVKESREERLAPITLIDRTSFVDMLSREGIGVKTYQVPVTLVDMAFIDDLSE